MTHALRTVTVSFKKREEPVADEDIRVRMAQALELARGERILSLSILTREFKPAAQLFVFEGGWWQRSATR